MCLITLFSHLPVSSGQRLGFAAFVNFANSSSSDSVSPPKTSEFIKKQMLWLRRNANNATTSYWRSVAERIAQFDGLVAGYQAAAPEKQKLSEFDLLVYMLQGNFLLFVFLMLGYAKTFFFRRAS